MGHLFYGYASTHKIMIWDIIFYTSNSGADSDPAYKEMVFAPGVKECQEAAKEILKRIKKDAELTFHIQEVTLDEN